MGRIGGADKLVVGDAKQGPDFARALGDGIDELLRRHFSLGGGLRDFLTVLVHSDQEMDIVALQAVIAGNRVGAPNIYAVAERATIGSGFDHEKIVGRMIFAPSA